jgi:NADH-quinone oxidoreductase subunit C
VSTVATWAEEVADAFDVVEEATYDEGFGPLTVTVPAQRWRESLLIARDSLGCTFFDWLSAVDELADGFAVVCHLAAIGSSATRRSETPGASQTSRGVRHLLLRTSLPREQPVLPSAVGIFAGASWHERETSEMFGVAFGDAPEPPTKHLLLPEEFEGHPLRKDFVLVSRVAKPWPGAKEPGESDEHGGSPSRRRTRPPGVPEEESWGPREPGSPAPDPLAHAQPGAARPRRAPRARPTRQAGDGDG